MKKQNWMLIGLSVLLVMMFSSCKKTDETEVDMSAFEPPADFVWEGNYMDEDGTTTLVIEKAGGKKYHCVINVTDEDVTHIDTYEFTAVKEDVGLTYENGLHTTFDIPDYESDPQASVTTEEVYSDGTGKLYYLKDHVYWLDDKNDAGSEFAFQKVTESDSTDDENVTEDTEASGEENAGEDSTTTEGSEGE